MPLTIRSAVGTMTTVTSLCLFAEPALAHGFGSRYELALPAWLFFVGSVAVVVASFALVSVFVGDGDGSFSYRVTPFSATPLRYAVRGPLVSAARAGVVLLFVVGVLAGFVGPQEYDANLYTLLVWVVWWVGYTFSVILVGNTWSTVNPWKTVYEWGVAFVGGNPTPRREYQWGAFPAVGLLFGFGWLEIVSPISWSPRGLATVTVAFSVLTWLGMFVYGKEIWIAQADPFARLFRALGRFAPLSSEDGGKVRAFGVGLVESDETVDDAWSVVFLVLLLYLVTFDGFTATPAWRSLALAVPRPPVPGLVTTVLMLVGLVAFLEAYLRVAALIARAADAPMSDWQAARRFALSLLPIAIGYQVSHYYTFLLLQGQFIVPALADPFGLGWNVLGFADFEPARQFSFLTVRFVWQSQVALIVLGHVVAVWVAHHIALKTFEGERRAVRSQFPMMGLMIAYTTLSLWILTLPMTDPPLP